jgi:hypothetical protein
MHLVGLSFTTTISTVLCRGVIGWVPRKLRLSLLKLLADLGKRFLIGLVIHALMHVFVCAWNMVSDTSNFTVSEVC